MSSPARERTAAPRVLWAATAVLVLLGLFAMHGLPVQQPMSTAMSAAMSAGATAATDGPGSDQDAAVMAGCGADGHCLVTVHPRPDVPAPALVRVETATPTFPVAMSARPGTDDAPTGRPPDLDELGISRT